MHSSTFFRKRIVKYCQCILRYSKFQSCGAISTSQIWICNARFFLDFGRTKVEFKHSKSTVRRYDGNISPKQQHVILISTSTSFWSQTSTRFWTRRGGDTILLKIFNPVSNVTQKILLKISEWQTQHSFPNVEQSFSSFVIRGFLTNFHP